MEAALCHDFDLHCHADVLGFPGERELAILLPNAQRLLAGQVGVLLDPLSEKFPVEDERGGTALTGVGMVLGTPAYMAPELIMGEGCDGRVDQLAG
jgi:hypothetical protein